jgi:hypothetical protein
MSFVSTYNSLSKNGWSSFGPSEYQLLASSANLTISPSSIQISNDGLNIVGIDGSGNSNIVYFNINSNNVITVANTIAGNLEIGGAGDLAYSKQTKDVVVVGAGAADVGGTNRGTVRVYKNTVSAFQVVGTANNQRLGTSVTCNSNGNIIGICDLPIGGNASAFIYQFNSNTWTLRDTINPFPVSLNMSTAMDSTGNVLVTSNLSSNTVVVYNYSGNTWGIQANLTPANINNLTVRFGQQIIINDTANTIVVTDPDAINNANSVGKMFIFKNISNVWSEYQQIDCPVLSNTFGRLVALNHSLGIDTTGDIISIPAYNNSNLDLAGTMIFSNVNGNYTLKQFLDPASLNVENLVVSDIANTGIRLAVISQDVNPISNAKMRCYSL